MATAVHDQPQRQDHTRRKFHPKSRSGCLTCKLRRVKCDEARPVCERCRRAGRNCEGYTTFPQKQLTKFLSSRELRSFHYFWERTLIDLSSLYGGDVWRFMIVQAAEAQPPLMHALVCIGALHECIENTHYGNAFAATGCDADRKLIVNPESDNLQLFALQQYNKSIRLLTSTSSPVSQENVLLACLLFTYVECMQHNCAAAVRHLQSALNIIDEYRLSRKDQSSALSDVHHHLTPIFARLDLQVLGFEEGYKPRYGIIPKGVSPEDGTPVLPDLFHSLSEVHQSLEQHLRWQLHLLDLESNETSSKSVPEQTITTICDRFKEVYGKIDEYDSAVKCQDPPFRRSIAFLKILYHVVMITTQMRNSSSECAVDAYTNDFEEMVFWIDEYMRRGEGSLTPVKVSYSFELGVVPILSGIVCRCRDPSIRRRALNLLRVSRRREALWDSFVTACACERVIRIEEHGLGTVRSCEDVPEQSRIRVNSVMIDMARSPDLRDNDMDNWFDTSGWLGIAFTRYPFDTEVKPIDEDWTSMGTMKKIHAVNNPLFTCVPRQIHRQSWEPDANKGFPSVFGVPFIWSWLSSMGTIANRDEFDCFAQLESNGPYTKRGLVQAYGRPFAVHGRKDAFYL